ncbi:MAG: DASS family sodium-coupled anion symporter [Luteolibacter sp.]|jgi:sodium-dependent dicarboxylate transporter 2/3/5|nr:DASS family sodium-coupled anion symporter [Luteolibacter sp.]
MSLPTLPSSDRAVSTYGLRQWSGWVLGPGILLLTLLLPPPAGLSHAAWHTAGAALLMATLWISESLPLPVTAMLPLLLFPLLGIATIQESATPYASPIIYLFLGGFLIALAMRRWNLHRRFAISLIGFMGARPSRIIAGFLLASAMLSMWVSNTATALMMLPIALSVVGLVPRESASAPGSRAFATALLLAVAYGSTAGGMATLIGTPPNALLAGYMSKVYDVTIGFGQWMLIGVPVTLVTLPLIFLMLTRVSFRLDHGEVPGMAALIASEKAQLGPLSCGERGVLVVFLLTALGWIFQPLLARNIPLLTDTTIAMAGALLLFALPVNIRRGEFVMDWEGTKDLPWGVLLLFGGGLSLAGMIEKHGLSRWLGELCSGLGGMPMLLTLAIFCFGILMLTELTSNTATAATFLPIAAAIAISLGQNPLLFLIPAALAANCSFMMPVGTPPNAIVFGSGHITLPQMARAGFLLNLIMVPLVIAAMWLLGPLIFGVRFDIVPDWAK